MGGSRYANESITTSSVPEQEIIAYDPNNRVFRFGSRSGVFTRSPNDRRLLMRNELTAMVAMVGTFFLFCRLAILETTIVFSI